MGDLPKEGNKEVYYFNVLNVIACFGVIMLHCNGLHGSNHNGSLWIVSNLIESIMCIAVPIFFMISGATLVDYRKRYTTKIYLKKRFMKTVIPFFIWSCIAGVVMVYLNNIRNIPFDYSFRAIVASIINTKYNPVYWFFIPLFSIYLSIPIVSLIPKKKHIYLYIIFYGFLTVSVLPTVFKLFSAHFNSAIKAPFVGGAIIYVFLGYYLANFEIIQKHRFTIYFLSIIGFCFLFFGTLIITPKNHTMSRMFYGITNFPSVLYSTGVFVFFKYLNYDKFKNVIWPINISTISKYSFGIYLIHLFYIKFFKWILYVSVVGLKWTFGGPILIYLISLFTVILIKKIPVVKKIIP